MTVTPTSTMALAVGSAIELLAASPTFQTRVGAANAAAAKANIYTYEAARRAASNGGEAIKGLRPFAIVDMSDSFNWQPISQGCSAIHLQVAGQITVVISDNARLTDIGGDDGPNDSYLDFLNFAGGVMDDMSGRLNNGVQDTFGFQAVEMIEPPVRTDWEARPLDGDPEQTAEDEFTVIFALTREGRTGA